MLPQTIQRRSSNFPAPLSPRADSVLIGVERFAENGEVTADKAPTDAQRDWLQHRRDELRASLAPASPRERDDEIAGLFAAGLAVEQGDETEIQARLEIYRNDLADLCAPALRHACSHFRRNARFIPKIAEIREEAVWVASPWVRELKRIESILKLKIIPPVVKADAERRKAIVAEERRKWAEAAVLNKVPALDRESFRRADAINAQPGTVAEARKREAEAQVSALASKYASEPVSLSAGALATITEGEA